jgi:hypothetical protein
VQTTITDGNNSFHYLKLKIFSRLWIQREIFFINIFGEVRGGIGIITNYPNSIPIFSSPKRIEIPTASSMNVTATRKTLVPNVSS